MLSLKCEHCNKIFEKNNTKANSQKFCSILCRRLNYYERNINKIKIGNRIRYERWYSKNKIKSNQRSKEYRRSHINKFKEYQKIWRKENRAKHLRYAKEYRQRYLIKCKARYYAFEHKQRGSICNYCGSNENLNFHHTDYIKNEGITLCLKCHNKEHLKLEVGK